jgi:hypothetical protein
MAYGFEAKNADGQVVIDSNFPAYQLFDEQTISGTFDSTFNLYKYPADNASLAFINIPVGGYAGKAHTGEFISSESSLTFRYLRIVSSITQTDLYGLKLFDELGNITYASGAEAENIKAHYRTGLYIYYTGGSGYDTFPSSVTFSSTYSVNEASDWYAISAPVYTTTGSHWQCSVIFRETSTYVHGVLRPYQTAPSNITAPEPFIFATA